MNNETLNKNTLNESESTQNARTLAALKNQAQADALKLAPRVLETLGKFFGKSITGNKKRITDAIRAIDSRLYVHIDAENLGNTFLGVKLSVNFYADNRSAKIGEHWEYIDGKIEILGGYFYSKTNILDAEQVKKAIGDTMEYLPKAIEKTRETAERIETAKAEQKKLCQALNDLIRGLDSEIAERFGITFTYYR